MNIIPSKANTAFSKVPHSITFSEILTPHQKMVWIMLDATCYNRETEVISAAKLAKKKGSTLELHLWSYLGGARVLTEKFRYRPRRNFDKTLFAKL